MKQFYIRQQLLGLAIAVCSLLSGLESFGQCPPGSLCNTGGTIENGQILYINTSVNSSVTLKNGAMMIIQQGGNFTGYISGNNGSTLMVQPGGHFEPSTAVSFSSLLTVEGTAILNSSFAPNTNFQLVNSGHVTFSSSTNDNGKIILNNTACGTLIFAGAANIQSKNTEIINGGMLVFQSSLTTATNTKIDNRGKIYVQGDFNGSGLINNQHFMVFNGPSNINQGDSLINLNIMVFNNSVSGARSIRNEGLFWITTGIFQFNNGVLRQNNPEALLRVDGTLMNNGSINATGNMYVYSTITNNGSVAGLSATKKMKVNKSFTGTQANLVIDPVTLFDSSNYNAGWGGRDICNMSTLPVSIKNLRGTRNGTDNRITWTSQVESNADRYEVQYSNDAKSFVTVGLLKAQGSGTAYSYEHRNISGAAHYYRLKMTDLDATVKYSQVIVLKGMPDGSSSLVVAGNPFQSKVSVILTSPVADQAILRLYDHGGRMVKQQQILIEKGTNNIQLEQLDHLASGVFMLEVLQKENRQAVKLIKR